MRFSSALLAVYVHPTVAMCGDLLVFFAYYSRAPFHSVLRALGYINPGPVFVPLLGCHRLSTTNCTKVALHLTVQLTKSWKNSQLS